MSAWKRLGGHQEGLHVTVVEALPRVLGGVTAPEIAAFYERVHRARRRLRTGVRSCRWKAAGSLHCVWRTARDGRRPCVMGGVIRTPTAEAAGIEV